MEMNPEIRECLGRLTNGIYVLTSSFGSEKNGMIASWVTQISYYPPLVMVAVHPNRFTHHLIEKSGVFALHVIGERQSEMLTRFKAPEPSEKFIGINWSEGDNGCPILKDCIAWIECEAREELNPGNHTLFIGEVFKGKVYGEDKPLCTLDLGGRYLGRS